MASFVPTIMDKLTTLDNPILPGRININEAPREILMGIPGFTAEIVDRLIEAREEQNDSENRKFETWPMVEGILTVDQMRIVAPLLTGGGDVYRAQVVGYYEQGASFARVEAVIDASEATPKVVLYRKLDQHQRGFPTSILGQRAGAL